MGCPDGLNSGTGLPPPRHLALCQIRARLNTTDSDGINIVLPGTGMLFYNKGSSSYIVTAGHNLYSHSHNSDSIGAELWFGRIGSSWSAKRSMRNYWICEEFFGGGSANPEFDFAVIRVDKVAGNEARPIPLYVSNAPFAPEILLSGYPVEEQCAGANMPMHGVTNLQTEGERNFGYAELATYQGMSGGPLLRVIDKVLVSLGHHIRGEGDPQRAFRFDEFARKRIFEDWLRV